jgi:lysophospholipase L1-like esterase
MQKIFVLGDSISIHYGPYLKQYLNGKMLYSRKGDIRKAEENLDVAQGANGGDSSNVCSYLESCAASGGINADILLLNCGLHDIKTSPETGEKQIPIEQYRKNLLKCIKLASEMKLHLIWIRITPVDDDIHNSRTEAFYRYSEDCDAYNRAADEIMNSADIPVIDLAAFTANLDEKELFIDHVHFSEPVRKLQAAYIAGFLNSIY